MSVCLSSSSSFFSFSSLPFYLSIYSFFSLRLIGLSSSQGIVPFHSSILRPFFFFFPFFSPPIIYYAHSSSSSSSSSGSSVVAGQTFDPRGDSTSLKSSRVAEKCTPDADEDAPVCWPLGRHPVLATTNGFIGKRIPPVPASFRDPIPPSPVPSSRAARSFHG